MREASCSGADDVRGAMQWSRRRERRRAVEQTMTMASLSVDRI